MDKLTGKRRYRTNIFGQLILQVQYEGTIDLLDYYYPTTHTDTFIEWRDAKVTDLKVLEYA